MAEPMRSASSDGPLTRDVLGPLGPQIRARFSVGIVPAAGGSVPFRYLRLQVLHLSDWNY